MTNNILLVDQELSLTNGDHQHFEQQLGLEDCQWFYASDGIEALEMIKADASIEVIITDIHLPEVDGFSLIEQLQTQAISYKIIILSNDRNISHIRKAMNLGAYDFLSKPIDFEDLQATLKRALSEVKAIRAAEQAKQQLQNIQEELSVANKLQQSILPSNFNIFPKETGFELSAEMIPAKTVGGDFYDFFQIDESRWGFVIGDVSGKGMPAALFMAISRTLIRAIGRNGVSAGECLKQVNTILSKDNPMMMFVTVFYGIVEVQTGLLEYCNAGHNPPRLRKSDGLVYPVEGVSNAALGIMESLDFKSGMIRISKGDSLILYTDGITEAIDSNQEFFSEDRLDELLEEDAISANQTLKNIILEVRNFAAGTPQSDDITCLIIQRK